MSNQLTDEEVEVQRQSSLMVSKTLTELAKRLKPGLKTIEIDRIAEAFIRDHGGVPSFKGYGAPGNQFPHALCISTNEVVVHGFPSDYELKDGDVISIDCGVYMNGFHGDHAYTFAIGDVPQEVLTLIRVTKESLYKGIEQAVVGNRVGDIGWAIENHTYAKHGYGVVRELVGHGVGRQLHEDPQIPNYGRRGSGKRLKENMILAIEPMINLGSRDVVTLDDGWSVVTADREVSVHFEHNVCVKKGAADILSDFGPIEQAERENTYLRTDVSPGNS